MILNNHVCIKLSAQDQAIFRSITQASPLPEGNVLPEDMFCTILYANQPIDGFILNEQKHVVIIEGADIRYDPKLNMKNVVITLDAPTLIKRREEICKEYNVKPIKDFDSAIVLIYDLPAYNKLTKWYINNCIINTFNGEYKGSAITLQGESLVSTDGNSGLTADLTILNSMA